MDTMQRIEKARRFAETIRRRGMFLAGDPETLRLLVVDLCDEVEQLHGELEEACRESVTPLRFPPTITV